MPGMSVRECLRFYAAALYVWLGAIGLAGPAFADERPFAREDYESYFAPGRFATFSPFYQSDGTMEVLVNRKATISGRHVLEQTTHSFDVSSNYDLMSEFDYYKIESRHTDLMMWDEGRELWVYDYTNEEFDNETARVWESQNNSVDITDSDVDRGSLHAFYRAADKRAGRDAALFDKEFRGDVIGLWTWKCAWISGGKFDVECKAAHEKSLRVETYFYRKLDLVG